MCDQFPAFDFLTGVFPTWTPCQYEAEMALQSVVVPMLVLINNEKKYSDSVDVLDQLEVWVREIHTKAGLCAPPVGEHVPPGSQITDPSRADEPAFHIPPIPQADDLLAKVKIPCFGDQLTRVRLACPKNLRASSHTAQDRLDHLYPFRIVDWHTKILASISYGLNSLEGVCYYRKTFCNTGNFFRFPFGNFMGLFPTTVKNLGQEIPCMGKYWEVDASHDYTNGFFLGKRFHFTMYPRTGKIL